MKLIKWCKNFKLGENNETEKLHPAVIYEESDDSSIVKVRMITSLPDEKTKRELLKEEFETYKKDTRSGDKKSYITKNIVEAEKVKWYNKLFGKTTIFYKED
jgi:hypothetical protein